MKPIYIPSLLLTVSFLLGSAALAQQPPDIGYMFPPGGQAGSTVDVVLGGYDWTPDMQVFVLDPRVKLEIAGPPGPVIVPEPPYWFDKKARRGPFLQPRETPARLTIPAEMPPGVVSWQAANANGATTRGHFVVGGWAEVVEVRGRTSPQEITSLPTTVNGQVLKIEEVDRYRFTATKTGPITCQVVAAAIGSPLNAVLEIRDGSGALIADAADTVGQDIALTFAGQEGAEYTASIYDVDFRGNRAFVYRLSITPGPRVAAAIPSAGRHGETRPVEFVGYGLATGKAELESVTQDVAFPPASEPGSFEFILETPWGTAPSFSLLTSDLPETIEPAETALAARKLTMPAAVSGVLEQRYEQDRYLVAAKQGDVLSISVETTAAESPLDLALAVLDAEGKQVAMNDDLPGSTSAGLEFTAAADGDYQLLISDSSGNSGTRAAVYRLVVRGATPGFQLSVPDRLNLPISGKAKLAVTAARTGGFKEPIAIEITGLPAGITTSEPLEIAAGKNALSVELSAAADMAASAALVQVTGSAAIAEQSVKQRAGELLLATTITPPFTVDAEGKDDVTKWPRGTTFPGPVLIERDAGFNGEIVLEMAAKQGRHRQGITGPELAVPPGVERILYPIFLPEWLETTRTSRMVVNGVAKVADPQGNVRYSSSRLKTRIGFLPTGALLKISSQVDEIEVQPGEAFDIHVAIGRSRELVDPANIELQLDPELTALLTAEPLTVDAAKTEAVLHVIPASEGLPSGERELVIRATVLEDGHLPVVSEARVLAIFSAPE